MSEGSRRERDKTAKQARIFAAARDLFAAHGFDAVTTQQIADAADVAAGTVFRYAATKGELLLMVYNEALRAAVSAGLAAASAMLAAGARTADAVQAAVAPLLDAADKAPDIALYQRELLFGSADAYRAEGLGIIADFERGIARLLAVGEPHRADRLAARAVFAVVHLTLVHPEAQASPTQARADLRIQLAQIVAGHQAGAPQEQAGDPRRREGRP